MAYGQSFSVSSVNGSNRQKMALHFTTGLIQTHKHNVQNRKAPAKNGERPGLADADAFGTVQMVSVSI
jgi:hypothetical protein